MISLAIQLLATQLNQHLRCAYDLSEDMVVVSNLLDMDGSISPNINNKLVISLTNVEKDSVSLRTAGAQEIGERTVQRNAELNFNLYVMLTANFSGTNYAEALKFLSSTFSYFQRNPLFNHQNTLDMDSLLNRYNLCKY